MQDYYSALVSLLHRVHWCELYRDLGVGGRRAWLRPHLARASILCQRSLDYLVKVSFQSITMQLDTLKELGIRQAEEKKIGATDQWREFWPAEEITRASCQYT